MKMSPREVELTLRDIGAGIMRGYIAHCIAALRQFEPKAEMAEAVSNIMFPVENLVRLMEEGYKRGTIPAPAAVKEKVTAALIRINAEIAQLTAEVFASE